MMRRPRWNRTGKSTQVPAESPTQEPSAIFDRLSNDVDAPDLTRSIMGRLGYMPVSPTVARRHKFRAWAGRAGMLFTAAIALGIGFNFYLNSAEIRRPVGPTISDALRHDWQQQQKSIGSMIQTIQNLSPAAPSEQFDAGDDVRSAPADSPETTESWIAPVRWV
jgi:hypothetical protein